MKIVQRISIVLWVCLVLGLLARTTSAGVHYQVIKRFGFDDLGQSPPAPPIEGSDGALYGTVSYGGAIGHGAVFRVLKDGSGYSVLHSFMHSGDGESPQGILVQGSATPDGGVNGDGGTVFKLNMDGSGYIILHSFSGAGVGPVAGLVEGNDGVLYGTTELQDDNNAGTVFKIHPDGTGFAILHHFSTNGVDGKWPTELIQGSDDMLYGITALGGSYGVGSLFKLNRDGSSYGLLLSLGTKELSGANPSSLLESRDGVLYGTTTSGGNDNGGTVFKLSKDGSNGRVVHSFSTNAVDGHFPRWLFQDSNGGFYGVTVFGGTHSNSGTLFKMNADGADYKVLHSFGSQGDGQNPTGVIQGRDGRIYGSTDGGGATNAGTLFGIDDDGTGYALLRSFDFPAPATRNPGALTQAADGTLYGTTADHGTEGGRVFALNTDGSDYRQLHIFALDGVDGVWPNTGLVQGRDGALYGTTYVGGGAGTNCSYQIGCCGEGIDVPSGCGTVFKVNLDGTGYRILHSFGSNDVDGVHPSALIQARDNALYGMTGGGAAFDNGTVFKLQTDGTGFVVLHTFDGTGGGELGSGSLIEGHDGVLYGSTCCIVFKLDKDGTGFGLLHSYEAGSYTFAGIMEGTDRVLYGSTSQGGTNRDQDGIGLGTVFRLNPDGTGYAVLHNFSTNSDDGEHPFAPLIEGSDGALYGTTREAGSGDGTAFRLNKDGSGFAILQSFRKPEEGLNPVAPLLQATDGTFYGSTWTGGSTTEGIGGSIGAGAVFRLWPPQTPDITGITASANAVQVSISGSHGYAYQLMSSTNLSAWNILTNLTMPPEGIFTYLERPWPNPAAYYRAKWVR